jgi:TonB family protein
MRIQIGCALLILLPGLVAAQSVSPSPKRPALCIYAPKPDYPLASRALHHTGSGLYLLRVGSNGTVQSFEVLKSTGHPDLDQAATDAFSQWRFKPGTVKKVKIPMSFTMTGVRY